MTNTVLTDEQIIGILEENRPEYDGLDKAITVSREIEQAVLQSEQVKAWKKDAERLNWIEGQLGADIACDNHNEWWVDWAEGYVEATSMRDAIDTAMDKMEIRAHEFNVN